MQWYGNNKEENARVRSDFSLSAQSDSGCGFQAENITSKTRLMQIQIAVVYNCFAAWVPHASFNFLILLTICICRCDTIFTNGAFLKAARGCRMSRQKLVKLHHAVDVIALVLRAIIATVRLELFVR